MRRRNAEILRAQSANRKLKRSWEISDELNRVISYSHLINARLRYLRGKVQSSTLCMVLISSPEHLNANSSASIQQRPAWKGRIYRAHDSLNSSTPSVHNGDREHGEWVGRLIIHIIHQSPLLSLSPSTALVNVCTFVESPGVSDVFIYQKAIRQRCLMRMNILSETSLLMVSHTHVESVTLPMLS